MSSPLLTLIVSTIGRPDDLHRLVKSLTGQEDPRFELVVVDQSPDSVCVAMLADLDLPFRVATATSARGVSTGRNAGIPLSKGSVLAFPDDNCWYLPTTVASVHAAFRNQPDSGCVSGIQVTGDFRPSMVRWPDDDCPITRSNVHRTAISSSMFLRRAAVEAVGGFDETMGVGSPGPFQAGEDTDLVLRLLDRGLECRFTRAIQVAQDDPRDHAVAGLDVKMLGYGRGIGRLYRQHHLSKVQLGYYLSRKLGAATLRRARGRGDLATADLAWARGVVEGFRLAGGTD